MKITLILPIIFSLVLSIVSCDKPYQIIDQKIVRVNQKQLKEDSLLRDTVFNFNYSRLSKPNSSGLESVFYVPEKYKNKPLRIIFNGKSRTNQVYTNASVVISLLHGSDNQILIWKVMSLRYAYTDVNKWCWVSDSIDVGPTQENKTYSCIDVITHLGNTTLEKFDMDSLIVTIKCKI